MHQHQLAAIIKTATKGALSRLTTPWVTFLVSVMLEYLEDLFETVARSHIQRRVAAIYAWDK